MLRSPRWRISWPASSTSSNAPTAAGAARHRQRQGGRPLRLGREPPRSRRLRLHRSPRSRGHHPARLRPDSAGTATLAKAALRARRRRCAREWVIGVRGIVVEPRRQRRTRSSPTGEIEVHAVELTVFNKARDAAVRDRRRHRHARREAARVPLPRPAPRAAPADAAHAPPASTRRRAATSTSRASSSSRRRSW